MRQPWIVMVLVIAACSSAEQRIPVARAGGGARGDTSVSIAIGVASQGLGDA